jgi:hypothetical protein
MYHFVTQYYRPGDNSLLSRIEHCLHYNSAFDFIDRITLLVEGNATPPRLPRCSTIRINSRATFADFLEIVSARENADYNIIFANSDILLDPTVVMAGRKISLDNTVAAITRREIDGRFPHLGNIAWSQDTWIMRPHKVSASLIHTSRVWLGTAGCENVFASQLIANGYNIWNPCLDVLTFHNDPSPCTDYSSPSMRYFGYYTHPIPCFSEDIEKTPPLYDSKLCSASQSGQNWLKEIAVFILTIDILSQRFQTFAAANQHLELMDSQIFSGVVGTELSSQEIVESGLATQEVLDSKGYCTPGLLGNAASHRMIWQEVAQRERGVLVIEDDAIVHPQIASYIRSHLPELESRDITFFGYNTNAPLSIILPVGLEASLISRPIHPPIEWSVATLSSTDITKAESCRLLSGFGMLCYWISTNGAARLSNLCFPLSMESCSVPLLPHNMPGVSIDRRLCSLYSKINAAIIMPPLAYSENLESLTA